MDSSTVSAPAAAHSLDCRLSLASALVSARQHVDWGKVHGTARSVKQNVLLVLPVTSFERYSRYGDDPHLRGGGGST